jgi:hypothetical protein
MSPTRLTKLQIRSVFRKSQGEEKENTMSDGVISVAKRAASAIANGEIDQVTFAKLQQRLAQEQFPNDSMGVALSKFYATPHGAEMLNRGLKANYEAVQRANARSAHGPLAKAFGNPASRQGEFENPDVARPSDEPHTGGVDTDEPFEQQVERLMKERNISRDAAITLIYRAEKISKGVRW